MNPIKDLLNFIFKGRDSIFIVITGFNQSGKTDLMLWLMENLYYFEFVNKFGLNQHIENQPFEYDFIRDLKTLIKRCIMLKEPYFYFLDELAKSANKSTSWEKTNLGLIKALEVRRKYRLHIGGCGIGEIDRRILSPLHLDVLIEKTGLKTARVHHIQRKKDYPTLYNLPPTTIKFKEHEAAVFLPEPETPQLGFSDIDVTIAIEWSKGIKYVGDLSKPSYYEQIKRGIKKLHEITELGSSL